MIEIQLNNNQTLLVPDKNAGSRYYFTPYAVDSNNKIVFQLFIHPTYVEGEGEYYHTVTQVEENRLDIVAKSVYNNSKFWWLLALANNIIDPTSVPKGSKLLVPSVQSYVTKGNLM